MLSPSGITLNDNDTDESVVKLCELAKTSFGSPAAVCVYPQFISVAKTKLNELGLDSVNVAVVTNFPHGNDDVGAAVEETRLAIELGADEVDVVFPFRALMRGDEKVGHELVKQCKQVCGAKYLKVIIEVGELNDESLIKQASRIAIDAGADFIKTSTGKVAVNATPESARMMLEVIAEKSAQDRVGFKAAGGVKTAEEAKVYLDIAESLFGKSWITSEHFRFGASSLLGNLVATLNGDSQHSDTSSY